MYIFPSKSRRSCLAGFPSVAGAAAIAELPKCTLGRGPWFASAIWPYQALAQTTAETITMMNERRSMKAAKPVQMKKSHGISESSGIVQKDSVEQ